MTLFMKCERAGEEDGNLKFETSTQEGKRYRFAMSPECFMHLFGMGWQAAKSLAASPQTQEAFELPPSEVKLAIVRMKPTVMVKSGPFALSLPLDRIQMAYLLAELDRMESELDEGPVH